jgi:hypothetical protein
MDRLTLTVVYDGANVRTFVFGKRLAWLENEINCAMRCPRSIVEDPRAIRTVDYEILCPRECEAFGPGVPAGIVVLFETGVVLACSDERAKHLRRLLMAAAECRSLNEHVGVHEQHEHEKHPPRPC